jgi:hypothetical protein
LPKKPLREDKKKFRKRRAFVSLLHENFLFSIESVTTETHTFQKVSAISIFLFHLSFFVPGVGFAFFRTTPGCQSNLDENRVCSGLNQGKENGNAVRHRLASCLYYVEIIRLRNFAYGSKKRKKEVDLKGALLQRDRK